MPYRLDGLCVQVQKNGEWQEVKCHSTISEAQAHLAALQANVDHKSLLVLPSVNLWTPLTVKSVKGSSDKRLRGTSVRYFDKDTRPDLEGDWFSKRTYLMRDAGYPMRGAPVNIHHGFRERFGNLGIGLIDFTDETELGIEYEAMLFEREQYEKMLEELGRLDDIEVSKQVLRQKSELAVKAVRGLLETVPLQSSGGFDPATWRVDEKTRHIDQAGLIHQAITHMPADSKSAMVTFKSISDVLKLDSTAKTFKLGSIKQAPKQSPTGLNPKTGNERAHELTFVSSKGLSFKMDEQALIELIRREIAAALAAMQEGEAPMETAELAKAETDLEEEVKADVEEEVKAMPEEEVKGITADKMDEIVSNAVAKHLPGVIEKALTRKAAKQNKYNAAIKAGQVAALNGAKSVSQTSGVQLTMNRNNRQTTPYGQVSVNEPMKYAHMTALDMAMGWKIATAASPFNPSNSVLGFQGRNATDYVSEEFYTTAMHKAVDMVEKTNFTRPQDMTFLKSLMPFKANELDASNITGQGLEWLGNVYDTSVWETARNTQMYKLMQSRGMIEKEVPQGMRSVIVPIEGNDPTVYGGIEGNSVDATGRPEVVYKITPITTSTITVTPGTMRTATAYTFQLGEDSFVDMSAEANRKVKLALEEHIEKGFINGDSATAASTNINAITATPTSTGLTRDYYLEMDGLRKSPLVTSASFSRDGGALAIDDYRRTWALLGSTQAPRKENIFFLIDFNTYQASLDLLPTLTRDVAGDKAALFTGNLDDIWGIPIYMSGFLALSNTAGKIDTVTPGNNTKGQILAVYAPYWAFTFKRNITIEMERNAQSESFEFYGSMRFSLVRRSSSASAISYNLTV